MYNRITDFQNDPNWYPSVGEKFGMAHYRNGNFHAECDPQTGNCSTHYDEHDPNESLTSLFQHLKQSDLGKVVLVVGAVGIGLVLDQVLTGGQVRNSLLKSLRS